MEDLFDDGNHVWLRSRPRGLYLHADEDGRGVSLRAGRATRRAAWKAYLHPDGYHTLLQGAAYGRYLSATGLPATAGHRGYRVEQRGFDNEGSENLYWHPLIFGTSGFFMIGHASSTHAFVYLRANGRYLHWERGVTIGDVGSLSSMMMWEVQLIPQRDTPPPLPPPRQPAGFFAVLLGLNAEEKRRRDVRYVRADHNGSFDEGDWVEFEFVGRSVTDLESEMALRLDEELYAFTMCVHAGVEAHLTPLVVDLPTGEDTLHIVILMAGSPALLELQHPDVDGA